MGGNNTYTNKDTKINSVHVPLNIQGEDFPGLDDLHDLDVPLLEVLHGHGEGIQLGRHVLQVLPANLRLLNHLLESAEERLKG